MQMEIDGAMVDVMPVSKVQEYSKTQDWYNADLDAVGNKRHASAMAQGTKALEESEATHAAALLAATQVNSGKSNEVIEGLTSQVSTITATMKAFEQRALDAELKSKTGSLKGDLAALMGGVEDPYVRNGHINDAMNTATVNGEVAQFTLKSGAFGGPAEYLAQLQNEFPQHFTSNQPGGVGLTGGTGKVPVPNKPYSEMSVPEKAAYLEQKGK